MKHLHRFFSLAAYAAALFVGLSLFLLSWSPWAWQRFFALVSGARPYGGILGAMLFLGGILWMLGERQPKRQNRFLSFRNEEGAVHISTAAISDYLDKLAPSFPSIVQMHADVLPVRRKIDIIMEVRIKAGPQLHEICEVLQKRVRESMESGLGIHDVRHVIVRVKEISSEHKA